MALSITCLSILMYLILNVRLQENKQKWMLTTHEFEATIKELHKNNYILIDPHDAYDFSGDKVKKKELKLPNGKNL